MGRKRKDPAAAPAAKEKIPNALALADGHYMENDGAPGPGSGFHVKDGKIHLSVASFAPMEQVLEKRARIEELVRLHNRWAADELAGLRKAENEWWDRIHAKLSIPRDVNITVSWNGVISPVEERKPDQSSTTAP